MERSLIFVARGLASRLRLKPGHYETQRAIPTSRQGPGISVEIETFLKVHTQSPKILVARGLASRLRLKLLMVDAPTGNEGRRQGPGISVEIETMKQLT